MNEELALLATRANAMVRRMVFSLAPMVTCAVNGPSARSDVACVDNGEHLMGKQF